MPHTGDIQDQAAARHSGGYAGPYTARHPVPTVQGYREHQAELQQNREQQPLPDDATNGQAENGQPRESKTKRAYESVKAIAKDEDQNKDQEQEQEEKRDPYPATNRNWADRPHKEHDANSSYDTREVDHDEKQQDEKQQKEDGANGKENGDARTATEQAASTSDAMAKRKAMKKNKRTGVGREVTDPVTHLPITVHDMTDRELEHLPENLPTAGSTARTSTRLSGRGEEKLTEDRTELDRGHRGMREMFPPPVRGALKGEVMQVYATAVKAGMSIVGVISLTSAAALLLVGGFTDASFRWLATATLLLAPAAAVYISMEQVTGWLKERIDGIFDDQTWEAARQSETAINEDEAELPESVTWLNSLLSSVWPLINPDLFTSLADTLEDVMQASLPKVIRMVSVDDLGQGSQAIRILGLRWLPTGAAGQSVDSNGQIIKGDSGGEDANGQDALQTGMDAEEGEFVNLELAFSYRARSSGKAIKDKARNAHLYLKFYLPGGVAVPVWVELRGIVGIMRLRLQLTPDPPFFSLCTLTFLGQPRADISCVPLSKHSPNIMDVPLISKFVQSSIDAALAEYVAPKSMALDLKDMLVGDDFKKDTVAKGVILVHVKRARGFKEGDGGIGPLKGSSDSYVTVSWGKLGKPVGSTRIIVDSRAPNWDEWVSVLVTPEEMDAEETLRLQIWDSDKHTADDDLGRVEVSLRELTQGDSTKNSMCDREDGLRGDDPEKKMPGKLTWAVGYFSKTRIQTDQLEAQTIDTTVRSTSDLEAWASQTAKAKLRESSNDDGSPEHRQQTIQDFKEREDQMVISTTPPSGYPSGVLSIQIHNITGLEIAKLNARKERGDQGEDGTEQSDEDNLPDSYCSIFLNHSKVYNTRTKPKSANPFFNAGTERFVRDWRSAEVMVSVRDRREHENDPLLGVVYLPLKNVFEKRSQLMDSFPLVGGIGYGRARISLVWRSFECQLPVQLTGWEYGTLEVHGPLKLIHCDEEKIQSCKVYLKAKIAKGKMKSDSNDGVWWPKGKDRGKESVFLAVAKRYATPLVLEFRQKGVAGDSTPFLAVLWLSEIPDEEEQKVVFKVWRGGKERLARARSCTNYAGLEDGEGPVGEVEVSLKFWRGLGGYHKKYAGKASHGHVRDAMEVLDTIHSEGLVMDSDSDTSDSDSDADSSESDSDKRRILRKGNDASDQDTDPEGFQAQFKKRATSALTGDTNVEDDGSRGARAQIQDYRDNHKQLHRKHRGVMQWKAARTVDWMAGKVSKGKGKVVERFEHGDKDTKVETEV